MKFKVGDRVKVGDCYQPYKDRCGKIGTVMELHLPHPKYNEPSVPYPYWVQLSLEDTGLFAEHELELVT